MPPVLLSTVRLPRSTITMSLSADPPFRPQAPTSSSLGKSKAAAASTITDTDINRTRDPMQKKLLRFRQKKATVNGTGATVRSSKAAQPSVQTPAAAAAGARGRPGISRVKSSTLSSTSTTAPVSGAAASAAVAISRTAPASAASRGGRGRGGGGGADSIRGDGVFRVGVTAAATTTSRTAGSRASGSTAPGADGRGRGAAVAAKNGPENASRTVSKPVTTVKRSVGGNAAAAAAAAGGRGRGSKEKSGGVKRKGPVLLSSNVTDRKRWVGRVREWAEE